MVGEFETERLIARRLSASHFPDLCRMHRDARVMATLGGIRSDSATRMYLDANLKHWEEHGFGLCALFEKSGQFAGRAGLRRVEVGGAMEVELAYSLVAECWGVGLATEIGKALIAIGFGQLGFPDIVCFTFSTNHASRRVMEKLGFAYERDIQHGGHPHVLFRLMAPRR